ncbi:MAG: SGNH/GDSL hydrolase family protein [Nitrospiraceae bacterium]
MRILKGILLVIFVNLVLLEVLLRAVNWVYPLERPAALVDETPIDMLEGDNWLNAETRLYRYKPDTVGKTYGHPFRVNRWGFRGRDFADRAKQPTNRFRIAIVGDSMTAGTGVAEESRFADILERRLHEHFPSQDIEVVNLGVQGFETIQEDKMLRRMWEAVGPDLVIVAFYVNDTNITYEHYLPYQIPFPQLVRSTLEHLLLFRQLEPWYDGGYRWWKGFPSYKQVQQRARNPDSHDWQVFAKSVQNIGQWVRSHLPRPPLVLLTTYEPHEQWDSFHLNVRRTFEQNGFLWVEPQGDRYRSISRFEFHPDEGTHEWYADTLFQAIVQHRLIPVGDPLPVVMK